MPKHTGQGNLAFIVSTNTQKLDPTTRKLIRSHVMIGKNRKAINKSNNLVLGEMEPPDCVTASVSALNPEVPRLWCSRYAGFNLAADVEPSLIDDVLLFASISSDTMFFLKKCIEPTPLDVVQSWFMPMLADPTYVYAACLSIQTLFEGVLGRTRSAQDIQRDGIYYARTVRQLQKRLASDDDSVRLADSTIMTVMFLSGHAFMNGELETHELHLEGLLKLVGMRGASAFLQNTRVMIEIIRSDLAMAVDLGRKPVLFTYDDIPWDLISLETSASSISNIPHPQLAGSHILQNVSTRLFAIWSATVDFSAMVNKAHTGKGPAMSETLFLHYMGSIMYRLLGQRFNTGSLDEALRLGLVAFLYPIFLNWNDDDRVDGRFYSNYRVALAAITSPNLEVDPRMRLWLFMVGAIVMSSEPESLAWLESRLRLDMDQSNISSWPHLKQVLESLVWINQVYDVRGKVVYDSMLSQSEHTAQIQDVFEV